MVRFVETLPTRCCTRRFAILKYILNDDQKTDLYRWNYRHFQRYTSVLSLPWGQISTYLDVCNIVGLCETYPKQRYTGLIDILERFRKFNKKRTCTGEKNAVFGVSRVTDFNLKLSISITDTPNSHSRVQKWLLVMKNTNMTCLHSGVQKWENV
jgi:hypothetical protein